MVSVAVEVLGEHAFFWWNRVSRKNRLSYGETVHGLCNWRIARAQVVLKHLKVRLLAIESWVSTGHLRLQKVQSAENVAAVVTKHVSRIPGRNCVHCWV